MIFVTALLLGAMLAGAVGGRRSGWLSPRQFQVAVVFVVCVALLLAAVVAIDRIEAS